MPKSTTKPASVPTAPTEPANQGQGAPAQHRSKELLRKVVRSKIFAVIVVLLLASIPAVYFYQKSQTVEKRLNDPDTANQQVIDAVVKKVGKLILLPAGEKPTLASVSDVNKVKDQPFFAQAQNGDKVLVYTQARKAILYRPSQNLIIEVAPLNVGSVNAASIRN